MRELTFFLVTMIAGAPSVLARSFVQQVAESLDFEESDYYDEAASAEESKREAEADANFKAIMEQNVINFSDQMVQGQPAPRAVDPGARVEVGLDRYTKVRTELEDIRLKRSRPAAPPVVLGGATYSGVARADVLDLSLRLQVTLGGEGRWKMVPLVGQSVVVVSASAAGRPVPLSIQNGYHVWVTQASGEVSVDLKILVPSKGKKGSIEYDFSIARTPVTRFACEFPVGGLEPRLRASVRSQISSSGSTTLLDATLRPTTRIHLVGFKDLGSAEGREAKIYAESLNLLSVDEDTLDLFTVVRYNILYAGTKEFRLQIPSGFKVISADGEGAFRFSLEDNDGGQLLSGETAFPIRNNYEISVRLHRELDRAQTSFDAVRPRPLGVEREHGWLGVEVTGKLKLKEESAAAVQPVDVRQLPPEMLDNAVSPILRAYRFHSPDAAVKLSVALMPEKEPESGSIDRVRAVSVLSDDGKLLTDLRITLRNRLRHHLALTLAEGSEVRASFADGQPIKPSRNEQGELMLPLKRSGGGARLEPFTLQVVLENEASSLGWVGMPNFELPRIDLPVSSVSWRLYLPARNTYGRLAGDIEPQTFWGTGQWHQPGYVPPALPVVAGDLAGLAAGPAAVADETADTGAMPVRIQIPRAGRQLEYRRYWLDKNQAAEVSVWFVRSWLLRPLWLLFALAFAFGLLLAGDAWLKTRLKLSDWRIGLGVMALAAWPLYKTGGDDGVVAAVLLGLAGLVVLPGRLADVRATVSSWFAAVRDGYKAARQGDKPKRTFFGVVWKIALAGGLFVFTFVLLGALARLAWVLLHPLAG